VVDTPQETVVVTGANGWLGRAVTARFSASSRVVAVVRNRSEGRAIEPFLASVGGSVDLAFADLAAPQTIDAFLARSSEPVQLVHTAGVIHPRRFADFTAVNAAGTAYLARAARVAGVARLVHISSNSPFGANTSTTDLFRQNEPYRPYLGYGESKMRAELAVLEEVSNGLDAVIIRPPWFYGPYQPARQSAFLSLIKAGRFPVFESGQARRSLVYIENLVDGIEAALGWNGQPGRAWWIADERPYTMVEIVETVRRALVDEGHDVKPNNLYLPAAVGNAAEHIDRTLQRIHRYSQKVHVMGELNKTIACDISASVAELRWQPQVALYEGMRRSIRWCAENGIDL
jgi:nucleoside-diphosphate-sugar epimerase